VQRFAHARVRAREDLIMRAVEIQRPTLRAVVNEADLVLILARIEAGSTFGAAATAIGCRPSALRRLKRTDLAAAKRLRFAWLAQGRRLRAKALALLIEPHSAGHDGN